MTGLITKKTETNKDHLNRDPRTGTMDTAAGVTSGAIAGAAAGVAMGRPVVGVIGIAVGAAAGREAYIRTFARDGKSTLFTMSAPSKRLFQRGLYPGYRAG